MIGFLSTPISGPVARPDRGTLQGRFSPWMRPVRKTIADRRGNSAARPHPSPFLVEVRGPSTHPFSMGLSRVRSKNLVMIF